MRFVVTARMRAAYLDLVENVHGVDVLGESYLLQTDTHMLLIEATRAAITEIEYLFGNGLIIVPYR